MHLFCKHIPGILLAVSTVVVQESHEELNMLTVYEVCYNIVIVSIFTRGLILEISFIYSSRVLEKRLPRKHELVHKQAIDC